MAITDLTNTTWTFLDDIDLMYFEDYKDWNIYFYTGDTSGASIFGLYGIKLSIADSVDPNKGLVLKYKIDASPQYDIEVVDERNEIWVSDYYKLIHISGGTDVTNSDLIDFITTFAIPYNPKVKDLRNTKWYFNDTLIRAGSGWWITYTLKDNPYVEIALDSGSEGDYLGDEGGNNYYEAGVWANQNYRYITFFEGEDDDYNDGLEDTSLIYWLELNATYLYPKPTFYRVTDLELTSIADAIRNKTGISSSLTYPNGFIDGINQLSDNTEEFMGIFNRTSSVVSNSQCTSLRDRAFIYNYTITDVSFPACSVIGQQTFLQCSSLTKAIFPNCTSIGSQAFGACIGLSSISFPNCEEINLGAFYGCTSLTIADFPQCTSLGISAFGSCNNLSSISFPNCTSISASAFAYCSSLTSVEFPECTYVGNSAFYNCTSLSYIKLPKYNSGAFSPSTFYNCSYFTIDLPLCTSVGGFSSTKVQSAYLSACTTLMSSAFYMCSSLTTLSATNCTTIFGSALYQTHLTNISFPLCTTVSSYALCYCTSALTMSLPQLSVLSTYTFANCYSVTQITLNSGVSTIPIGTFFACSSLTSVTNISQVTSIGSSAFYTCLSWSFGNFSQCTYVGTYAFRSCNSLIEVSLPLCASLPAYVFYSCYNLKSVFLSQCSSIGSSVFYRCYNLISLDFRNASSVPTLYNSYVFTSTPISTYSTSAGQYGSIYVPASLYDAFKTKTNWTYFSNRMVSV